MLAKPTLGVKGAGATHLEIALHTRLRKIDPDTITVVATQDRKGEGRAHLSGVGNMSRAEIMAPLNESHPRELTHAALLKARGIYRVAPSVPLPFARVGGITMVAALSRSVASDIATIL